MPVLLLLPGESVRLVQGVGGTFEVHSRREKLGLALFSYLPLSVRCLHTCTS